MIYFEKARDQAKDIVRESAFTYISNGGYHKERYC